MSDSQAVVVVTFHAEDNEVRTFGPFKDGDEASRWGFKTFPNNMTRIGCSVTWCWQDLVHPLSPYVQEAL